MRPARIEMQLGRNTALAKLAIDERGAIGRVFIGSAMMQGHGTRAGIKLIDGGQLHVHSVALPSGRSALLGIGGDIGRRIHYGPVDMAGYSVQSIDGLIGRSLRTGGKQQSQMRTSRLGDHPYLLGIDATLPGLTAYQAHGTLSILPGSLIDGQALRTRRTIYEFHTLDTLLGKPSVPLIHQPHVAATEISTTRDQYHAGIGAHTLLRRRHPLYVSFSMLVGTEPLGTGLVQHGGYLMSLPVRHLPFGPHGLDFGCRNKVNRAERKQ